MPIEVLGQTFEFGEVESGGEVIVPRSEDDGAGKGNGDQDGDDGDVGGMTSSGDVDSTRVEAALLAAGSQHMRQDQQTQSKNLLVSSMPPTYSIRCPNCSYGDVRRQHRHRRIKFAPIKVNQMLKFKMTYLGRTGIVQPCGNRLKRLNKVIGPRHRHGQIKIRSVKLKIEHLNDKRGKNNERTYLGCTGTAQPPINDPDRQYRVHRTRRRCGRMKIGPKNVNQMLEIETTHRICATLAQPLRNAPNNSK